MSGFYLGIPIISMLLLQGQPAVALAHPDGAINVVSLTDGKAVALTKSKSRIRAMALGPGGDSLVSGSEDGSIEDTSLLSGERLATGKIEIPADTQLTTIAMVPTKNLLAVGTSSGQVILLEWPSLKTRTYLFDRTVNDPTAKGVSFQILDPSTGRTVTYTLPCGSEIPPGAKCVCNCVAGTELSPQTHPPTPEPVPRITPPPVTTPGGRITLPCTPTPVPQGYYCTCNCIPGR